MDNPKSFLRSSISLAVEIVCRPMLAVFLLFLFIFMGINAACAVIAGVNPFPDLKR